MLVNGDDAVGVVVRKQRLRHRPNEKRGAELRLEEVVKWKLVVDELEEIVAVEVEDESAEGVVDGQRFSGEVSWSKGG